MAYNLRQCLEIIQSGNWCSLRFITANVNKRTGGKVMELAKCRIARNKPAGSVKINAAANFSGKPKDPNHSLHFTRNMELQNKQIVKVHPILITHINNIAVI